MPLCFSLLSDLISQFLNARKLPLGLGLVIYEMPLLSASRLAAAVAMALRRRGARPL